MINARPTGTGTRIRLGGAAIPRQPDRGAHPAPGPTQEALTMEYLATMTTHESGFQHAHCRQARPFRRSQSAIELPSATCAP